MFGLTLSGDACIDHLIDMARHDDSPQVRSQTLFWLAQKAGERAVVRWRARWTMTLTWRLDARVFAISASCPKMT